MFKSWDDEAKISKKVALKLERKCNFQYFFKVSKKCRIDTKPDIAWKYAKIVGSKKVVEYILYTMDQNTYCRFSYKIKGWRSVVKTDKTAVFAWNDRNMFMYPM